MRVVISTEFDICSTRVCDFLEYGQINIKSLCGNSIYMWRDGYQWGEIFYNLEKPRSQDKPLKSLTEGKKEHN